MGRQFFVSNAARFAPNTSSFYFNHAQKHHAALKSKCDKEKEHEVDWSDPVVRAWALGPISWECLYQAIFEVQYDWVMKVKQERANRQERARSLFGKHYLGIPGWDKPKVVIKPCIFYVKEASDISLEAKAVVPKSALAILKSNLKPVQPAADSSSVETMDISNIMAVPQQAAPQLALVLNASDIINSNDTTQQQACSSGNNSTPAVLPSSNSTGPENRSSSTKGYLVTFLNKMQGCINSFLAFELTFDVTIGYFSSS
jgi:hypothetical protein